MTGSRHWRMPFSDLIVHSLSHRFETNATWAFYVASKTSKDLLLHVPMFGAAAGVLNREFARMFKVLFGAVMRYLDSKGWADD